MLSIRKISLFTVLCFGLNLMPAFAEEFCGVGEYVSESSDSMQTANDMALKEAMRRVSEQATVVLRSRSVVIDSELEKDEIEMATASIMRILDRKFIIDATPEGGIKSTATIIAEVDMDKAEEMAKKLLEEKTKEQ